MCFCTSEHGVGGSFDICDATRQLAVQLAEQAQADDDQKVSIISRSCGDSQKRPKLLGRVFLGQGRQG